IFAIGFLGAYTGLKVFQPQTSISEEQLLPFNKGKSDDSKLEKQMNMIQRAYELIDEQYLEEVDEDQLMEGAIQGMLDTLEDPYSSYMTGEAMERFNEQITSSFQGIGAEVSMVDGKVTVVAPIKDSPAEKA